MSYRISETGIELLEDVRNFCSREIINESSSWDRGEKSPEPARKLMLEMGYQTLTIPEEYGGLGIRSIDTAAILEEISRADAGMAVTLAGSNLALRAVLAGGTEEQKEKVCGILGEGGLGAFCLTESQAGSDVSAMKTRAVPQEDGDFVISGTKMFITNGSTADFYCVAAVIEGQTKPSVFLINAKTQGIKAQSREDKLGIRSCDTCAVDFDRCRVPADALLGGEKGAEKGMKVILAALNEGRLLVSAMATGVAQRAMEEAAAYGKERYQFGKPVTDNQAIRFKLADMKIKIEAARQLTAYGLAMMDEEKEFSQEAAMAKAFASDTAVEVTGAAMEIFGGYGYSREFPAEKLMRDARVFQIIEGTGEMQRIVVADGILGRERK